MDRDWLSVACHHLASLLLIARIYPGPALLLVWFKVSQAGYEPPDPGDCAGQQLPDRISCGNFNINQEDCTNLGCCYDNNYHMCFFPVPCEQLAIVAGGYSALLLLPGRDHPSRGSMAMLEGGTWCSRDATHAQGSLQIEIDIPEVRLVYLTTTYTAGETFSHPFIFSYSVEKYKLWKILSEEEPSNFTSEHGGFSEKVITTVYANRIKVRPKPDGGRPCVKVEVITCPGVPPTEDPLNLTTVMITTPQPTEEPELVKGIDDSPTAIAVGTFVISVLAALLAFFILIDLPTYGANFLYMKRSLSSCYRYYRNKKRAFANGTVCRDKTPRANKGEEVKDNMSLVSEELLLSSSPGFDIRKDMEALHTLVHPEFPDEIGIGDWLTESDDASLVQYETVF